MKLTVVRDLMQQVNHLASQCEKFSFIISSFDALPKSKSLTARINIFTEKFIDTEKELQELRIQAADSAIALTLEINQKIPKAKIADVLLKRYVYLLPFAQIVQQSNYSEPSIYLFHRIGVKQFYAEPARGGEC